MLHSQFFHLNLSLTLDTTASRSQAMHMCSGSSLTKIEELLVVAKLDLRSLAFEMLHKIVDWPFPVFCPIGPIIRRIHGLSSGAV